ncbi:MAG TPA: potassium-transporting ATPase subunit KdpB [Rectinemataceae bacterium]|nr:potassium-transporting ATPase subunit KdpB [Rectinemataceae bacterium]
MSKHEQRFTAAMLGRAIVSAFAKLDPRIEFRNPVMFLVWVGTAFSTVVTIAEIIGHHVPGPGGLPTSFAIQIDLWLWFTLLFANFAESVAEVQGKARADSLRKMREGGKARLRKGERLTEVPASDLKVGDEVLCETGDLIPGDGEVIEGIASVDESAITGESAPVIRESGGDRSGVTGGTRVISDRIVVRITAGPGSTFIDKMILMVENATRQKTPGEIALTILLASLSIIFLLAVATLRPLALMVAGPGAGADLLDVVTLTALLVCLVPTTIGGLLSAIGISGVSRLMRKNVMALSGKAIEAAGDIDTLLLDKTGTITLGNRRAAELVAARGVREEELVEASLLASLADDTPEGKSIVAYVGTAYRRDAKRTLPEGAVFVPFTARTRMSGLDFAATGGAGSVGAGSAGEGPAAELDSARSVRKGAMEAIAEQVAGLGGSMPDDVRAACDRIARSGGTPLAVSVGGRVLGAIHLKDVIKEGIRERFEGLHALGIRTIMITGDNRLTAAAIAAEAGVSDFIAEARPEAKLEAIRREQAAGHLVGMIGDGTNDAPALAQADVGVAMASGSQTAREAGNMVDFDNDPAKVIDVVEVGKRLLVTRGSLTTFSIANDVAKYFAILPAVFAGIQAVSGHPGPLSALNIMGLASPSSAILSAVIFNALVIVALIPLALKGSAFSPREGASRLLARNLLVYGLGGLVVPFVGIKLIDMLLSAIGMA